MAQAKKTIDYIFLTIALILIIAGIFSFFSASLGVLARSESVFYKILISQIILGLVGGVAALYACIKIPYLFWRKHAGKLLIGSIILTSLVYVPHLGFAHGGARRWISIFGVSFQPVEFLKIGFITYLAAWLSWAKKKVESPLYGVLPLVIVLGIIASVLLFQPDTKSLILMSATGLAMLFLSGTPWKHLLALGGVVAVVFIALAFHTPYLRQRVATFMNPASDPTGSSYQLQQSLIAIGSGGVGGRGFGQSIQKFNYLPEPQGDSIFAVIGEEFGFIGSAIIILLYILFAMRGLWIARRAPDAFSGLFASGLVIIISLQAFMNVASIVGLFPLTGVPLVFMSQGGTSLLLSLATVGIILQISKERKV
ncbi:MAG: putative lipid II flippase FtsW [bacterium]